MVDNAQLPVLSYSWLQDIIAGSAAAVRARTRLVPAGGPGDKVFPPTYQGGRYAVEKRLLDGQMVDVVLLDAVQSQANRMELALKAAFNRGDIRFPLLSVDFGDAGLPHIGRITVLDAPHRIADAIFRDSLLNGMPFRESPAGRAFALARYTNATSLFALCPTALVFGVWDSTGALGGSGTKFARAIVSEIIGIGAVEGVRTASRVDPLPISRNVTLYQAQEGLGAPGGWTVKPEDAVEEKGKPKRYGEQGKASEANLGNVTPDIVRDDAGEPVGGGVTISYALQTTVLSLPALRRLHFPLDGKPSNAEVNGAARTLLAALALASVVYLRQEGYDLRSRCLLVPEEPLVFEVLSNDGSPVSERFSLPPTVARETFEAAVEKVRAVGLPWPETGREEIRLTPSQELIDLIRRSEALLQGAAV